MTEIATFYRTAFGEHRHSDWYCANSHRAIGSGDVTKIPANEVGKWAPCSNCCGADDVATSAAAAKVAADAMCPNTGVRRLGSRRLYDDCRDCGKNGKVLSNGTLRAHKPQK